MITTTITNINITIISFFYLFTPHSIFIPIDTINVVIYLSWSFTRLPDSSKFHPADTALTWRLSVLPYFCLSILFTCLSFVVLLLSVYVDLTMVVVVVVVVVVIVVAIYRSTTFYIASVLTNRL